MRKTSLCIVFVVFVVCLAAPTLADEGKPSKPSVVSVPKFLKQAAKSPLGPGEVGLLRAVADLVDKEQVAPQSAEPRKRLMVRLRNVAAADVATALAEFVENERDVHATAAASVDRAFFAADIASNSLLLSATRKRAPELLELIAELDAEPDTVMVSVCIGELTHADGDANVTLHMTQRLLQGEEAQAWLEEAKEQGRLDILSRPQIMTLDGRPAFIQIGSRVPRLTSTDVNQVELAEVGLHVGLTPRITPKGAVVMELDIQRSELVNRDAAGRATIAKTTVQTTVAAEDGQTVILGGLKKKTEDGLRELIIAVTPRVNPKL